MCLNLTGPTYAHMWSWESLFRGRYSYIDGIGYTFAEV